VKELGARLVACILSKQAPGMQKSADWMPCRGLRCSWRGAQSTFGPGPLDTPESFVSPGAGSSGAKSGNDVRAGGLVENAGETEIGGYILRDSSVTSPLFGHLPTQHPPYQSRHRRWRRFRRSTPSPAEEGATEVFFNSVLSSKSATAVSNGGGTSPCPPAPSVPAVAG
jgi:hypothetical protein